MAPRHREIAILIPTRKPPLGITSKAPWFHYPHCNRKTPPWNHFHSVEVSLSLLRPTKSLRGITSPVSRFHYPHGDRPNPFVDSLPWRRDFTIFTATDQLHGFTSTAPRTHYSRSGRQTLPLGITSTAPWIHYPGFSSPKRSLFD